MTNYAARRTWIGLIVAAVVVAAGSLNGFAQQKNFCGITPQSARDIAAEVGRLSANPFDSVSSAYYVSVLAARLSPYYLIFFLQGSRVVGEIEIDMCGRQGTPHPGLQYSADSEMEFADLLLEPDHAFAALKRMTNREAVFGSRVFPYGLTQNESDLTGIDFWWMILDDQGDWHYMTKTGVIKGVRGRSPAPIPAGSGSQKKQ